MPIIEFHCRCGTRFERILPMRETTVDRTLDGRPNNQLTGRCPKCGAPAQRIQISVPQGAHFVGKPDGFYRPSAKWD